MMIGEGGSEWMDESADHDEGLMVMEEYEKMLVKFKWWVILSNKLNTAIKDAIEIC